MEKADGVDEELLSAYLDGEVTPRERAIVEEALKHDRRLAASLVELRATKEAVADLPRLRAPGSFALQAMLPGERRWLLLAWRWATVAVAFLLVAVVGWGLLFVPREAGRKGAVQPAARPTGVVARAPVSPTKAPKFKALAVPEGGRALGTAPLPAPTPTLLPPTATPALAPAEGGRMYSGVWWFVAALAAILGVLLALKPGQEK